MGILDILKDLSWLNHLDDNALKISFRRCAEKTIDAIVKKLNNHDDTALIKDVGEYLVSVSASEAVGSELNYLKIPLAELLGRKATGNPGFDFHHQNPVNHTIVFGEAKYDSHASAYSKALSQIESFISEEKDLQDLTVINHFCSRKAMDHAVEGKKGFAAAFSTRKTPSERIIKAICNHNSFKVLSTYEEIILVGVNIW